MADTSKTEIKSITKKKLPNARTSKPRDASRHTAHRYLDMLQIIPREPKSVSTTDIFNRLIEQGYDISLKSVQRDLMNFIEDDYCLMFKENGKENFWYFMAGSEIWVFPGGMEEFTALSIVMANKFLAPVMPYGSGWMPHFQSAQSALFKSAEENISKRNNLVSQWLDKVHVMPLDFVRPMPEINAEINDELYAAVMHNHFLHLSYIDDYAGDISEHAVHPLGFIYRHPVVYLVAMDDADRSKIHRFAMHRIVDYSDTGVHVRPAGFNLKTYAEEEFGLGKWKTDTLFLTLWIAKDVALDFLDCPISSDQKLKPLDDNGFELKATVPNSVELRRFIRSLGSQVEVMEPEQLRKEFAETVGMLATYYGGEKSKKQV